MACKLLDIGDQHHPVFQQHGDSSRLRPMAKPTDPSAPGPAEQAPEQASFGYRDVPAAEKAGMVREVFDSVASRYDLMNDVMSAGVHRVWKDMTAARLNPQPGELIVDVAGGTGDMARRFARLARRARQRRGG